MKLRRITAQVAAAGATTALIAGGLVAATGTAANAATVTNTYTCSIPSLYSGDFDMTVTGEIPVPQYWAGAGVPQDLLSVTADVTVPADAAVLLASQQYTGAKSDDFAFALGSGKVPVPVSGSFATAGGATTWHATGKNKAFTTPNPGTLDALMPGAFTLTTTGGPNAPVSLNCALKGGTTAQAISTGFTLLRQASATTAPKIVKAKKGKAVKLPVSVTSTSMSGPVSSGKVVAKEGKKVLDSASLKKGKATLDLGKKLKKGTHKITVTYTGIPSVGASSAKSTVKVS
jgi:Bacterial Ig-like domain (group 3)/Family of unknown function (DUF6801)